MASVDLDYLETFRARGKLVAYYRRDGQRTRLRDEDGRPVDPADGAALAAAWQRVHAAHNAANEAAASAREARAIRPRSIADLIQRYRGDPAAYGHLMPATKADYEKALKPLENDWGRLPVAGLLRKHVSEIRKRYAEREVRTTEGAKKVPNARQANRVITVLSILLSYSIDPLGWRQDNPALRPKRLRTDSDGYRPWKQAEYVQFWERSDAEWRFNALFALLGGQRGQDQVAVRWTDYDGTSLYIEQQKGRKRVKIWVECHPALLAALDARRAVQRHLDTVPLTILARPNGQQWNPKAFQKAAGKAIRAAGLTEVVWHGLRGTAASWAADGGATEKMVQSLLGHLTPAASQRYMRGANQRRLASAAVQAIVLPMAIEENGSGTETAKRSGRGLPNEEDRAG